MTSLPGIIECNDLGATYVPTLFEFLSMKALELLGDYDLAYRVVGSEDEQQGLTASRPDGSTLPRATPRLTFSPPPRLKKIAALPMSVTATMNTVAICCRI